MVARKGCATGYVWMVSAALAFASMGALAHGLRAHFGWEIIALARSAVVLLLTAGLVLVHGIRPPFWRPHGLWVRSIAGTLSMWCVFFSLTRLPVAIVVTLMNLAPAWVAVLSWPFLKQRVSRGVWIAVLIGVAGVVLIQQPELAQGNLAILAPLASSFLVSIVMIALHRLQDVDHRAVVFHFSVVSTTGSVIVVLLVRFLAGNVVSQQPVHWLALLGVGVAATLGQLFLTLAFAAGSPAKVSIVGLIQVGFAMLYDIFIWDYEFGWLSIAGIVLVVAPTAWLLARERGPVSHELGEPSLK